LVFWAETLVIENIQAKKRNDNSQGFIVNVSNFIQFMCQR